MNTTKWLVGVVTSLLISCAPATRAPALAPARQAVAATADAEAPQSASGATLQLTSPLGRPLYGLAPGPQREKLEADLAAANVELARRPNDPEWIVWVGRRLAYLWRMNEAIAVFSEGIQAHPDYAPLYRHRGHRYISVREFDRAIADLRRAAELIRGRPDEIEADGAPNARNIPLTTLAFNVWYHLGVAHYLKAEFDLALAAFRNASRYTRELDDNVVAVTDWLSMSLRRLGRDNEAADLLEQVKPDMQIIENVAYFRRVLMYKGLIEPTKLEDIESATPTDAATLGYGLGNWRLCNGQRAPAIEVFDRVVAGEGWPAFGFIAAEADLARLRSDVPIP